MNDTELFELCKAVYKRTGWSADMTKRIDYVWCHETLTRLPIDWDTSDFHQHVPLYTSDYLLEKLPEWIGKYGDMQMSRGYMKGGTGAFRFFYGRDGQEASIEGTGTTAVSALLKLTIALSEAGELK